MNHMCWCLNEPQIKYCSFDWREHQIMCACMNAVITPDMSQSGVAETSKQVQTTCYCNKVWLACCAGYTGYSVTGSLSSRLYCHNITFRHTECKQQGEQRLMAVQDNSESRIITWHLVQIRLHVPDHFPCYSQKSLFYSDRIQNQISHWRKYTAWCPGHLAWVLPYKKVFVNLFSSFLWQFLKVWHFGKYIYCLSFCESSEKITTNLTSIW